MTRIRRAHLGFGIATLLLFTIISLIASFEILDTQWRADLDQVYLTLNALDEAELRSYRVMLAIDFLYAIAYAGFLILSIRYFAWEKRAWLRVYHLGAVAAALAALFDYIENIGILVIINSMPERIAFADILGSVTMLKWIAVGVSAGVLVLSALSTLVGRHTE